jgi:sulfopyruvate decarboxylase alpha subunit
VTPAASDSPAWAQAVVAGLGRARVTDVVYVPDNPLAHVLRALARTPEVRTILATREEEAVGIAAGLYLGGRRAIVMMQSSGLGNALNGIASLVVPYQVPVPLLISMRGEPGEWNAVQVPMGRAVRPVLEALGIQSFAPAGDGDVAATVETVLGLAFATRFPTACLLPRRLTAREGALP